jgi:DNA-binding NarL/FixJ family response regulator
MLTSGKTDKQIARALDIGLRTVELEKSRVAKGLGLHTSQVLIWAVENRAALAVENRVARGEATQPARIAVIAHVSQLRAERFSGVMNWSI